ncbi:MAG: UDP-N-acetylmuramoyl-L-alanine--D-glutamate ligase [Gammaproteobacteria bacterium]|nr:UDP-N-acetylmuramoyl-L-alanine--D-glutamate ligase [Gammaproteobacteria bacterium]
MRTLIIGGAVSGSAAARLAARLGYRVTVYDANPAVCQSVLAEGFATVGGPWSTDLLTGMELVVVSPGIPERAAPVIDTFEAGIPLWSELEFAARHVDAPLVAVTGTNGKTTVTSVIAAMLQASGMRAIGAGNIGTALSDVAGGQWDAVAVEASSFQLRFIEEFHPHVAVVLNLAPDHLDWHGSLSAYGQAKARIFENQTDEDVLIYDREDEGAAGLVEPAVARKIALSYRDGFTYGTLSIPLEQIPVRDAAFVTDLKAAAVAALEMGASQEAVEATVRSFRPATHRRTLVGTWQGVQWVDDSKATNPHAAVASIRAFPSVVLIAGGRNKGLDLASVAAVGSIRHLVLIGEATSELAQAAGDTPWTAASTMEKAVAIADAVSESGDTVLLAPACASFDMFSSYRARGDAFVKAVRVLKEGP